MWERVRSGFAQRAKHVTVEFVEDPGGSPVEPYAGYVRLWLVEGFLAEASTWGSKHLPVLHGGVALTFGGRHGTAFARFDRAPEAVKAPGAQLNFALTPLLPFAGGIVEMQAALYRASLDGPLDTAAELLGSLAPLLGPPLSSAAAVVTKVGDGLESVFKRSGGEPVLAVHYSLGSPGANVPAVRPGHLVVAGVEPGTLGGPARFQDGLLHIERDGELVRPTGTDFIVLRVECRTEHDSWYLPQLEDLVLAARRAYLNGQLGAFDAHRTEAISQAFTSSDLTPSDRRRVAVLVRDEVNAVKTLGVAEPRSAGPVLRPERLLPATSPRLDGVTLRSLLSER